MNLSGRYVRGWLMAVATSEYAEADEGSVNEARRLAEPAGVADRLQFHACTIEEFRIEAPYDIGKP